MNRRARSDERIAACVIAGGLIGFTLFAGSPEPAVGASTEGGSKVDHFVPADKHLPADWVQGLLERGATPVYRGKALETIGMPIGGIAAGQVYLLGDGRLGVWQIFNKHINTGYGKTNYARRIPATPIQQGFAVTMHDDGGASQTRTLDRQGFADVSFVGQYPIGIVRYQDKACPVKLETEAFSPFIPLNAKDSALPATLFHITAENASDRTVKVSIAGWLENAVCFHSASEVSGLRQSRYAAEKGRLLIVHTALEDPKRDKQVRRPPIVLADFEGTDYGDWKVTGQAFGKAPAKGTLPKQQKVAGFLGTGLVNTFLGGDEPRGTLTSPTFKITRKYLNVLVGGGRHPDKTCVNLVVDGKVVRTAMGENNERLKWRSWNTEALAGAEARIDIVDRQSASWGHINVDQIELSDERREGPSGPIDRLADHGTMVLTSAGPAGKAPSQRMVLRGKTGRALDIRPQKPDPYPMSRSQTTVMKTRPIKLARGAKHTWTFVLAWHFPNHQHGRRYATRFADASAVAHYVLDHHDRLTADTREWRDTYYDSTLPIWLLDRLGSTLSTLATGTCQWWGNGRFWAWEGVGCCAGTCTHVWNYQHALARLFPELERSTREMQDFGAGFNAKTGLVGFRSNRAYAADGQCGTVLKAYREHLMSPDDGFLKRNWPRIKKALEYSIQRDKNDDGLIEDSQHNTYDINFHGPNTFVGSLYLAALRAGEEMAKRVGDHPFATRARRIYQRGRRLSIERLWNGEYFVQVVDLKEHPKHQYADGCLSDQLFGQGWAHQLGLGTIYPIDHVRKALRSVWKYNWAPDVGPQNKVHPPERVFADPGEAGLFICTWPKSKHLGKNGVRYRNEVWTGIEYQVAGHMVAERMVTEGLAIVRAIHDRYHPLKRNPYNEVECGDHYARAMASWGVLTALAGYEYDGPRGHLGFVPKLTPRHFRSAFTTAEGWGTFEQERDGGTQQERIQVRWGSLRLRLLAFKVPKKLRAGRVSVTAAGRPVRATHAHSQGRLIVTLPEQVVLKTGQTLTVEIH